VKSVRRDIVESDSCVLDAHKPVPIGVLTLADSSIKIALRPWVTCSEYWPLRFDLQETIKKRFDAKGIEIPFPKMDVTFQKTTS